MAKRSAASEPLPGYDFFNADPNLIRHLSHPMRLRVYREAVRGPVSAKELSGLYGEPLARISYHVRSLADVGLLRPVRRTRRRGAVETHYRAVAMLDFDDAALRSLPEHVRRTLLEFPIREMTGDLLNALEEGKMAEPDTLLSRAHFVATAAGRRRLHDEIRAMYERLRDLQQELAAEAAAAEGDETYELNVLLIEYVAERAQGRNAPWVISWDREGEPPLDPIPPDL